MSCLLVARHNTMYDLRSPQHFLSTCKIYTYGLDKFGFTFFLAFVFRASIDFGTDSLSLYITYVLERPNGMQLYLISYTAAQMVGVFFVPEVSAKLDK